MKRGKSKYAKDVGITWNERRMVMMGWINPYRDGVLLAVHSLTCCVVFPTSYSCRMKDTFSYFEFIRVNCGQREMASVNGLSISS